MLLTLLMLQQPLLPSMFLRCIRRTLATATRGMFVPLVMQVSTCREPMQSTEFLSREPTSSHTFEGQSMAAANDDRTQTHVKVIDGDDDDNELPAHVRLLYSQTVDENDCLLYTSPSPRD